MEKFNMEMSAHFADVYEGKFRTLVYGDGKPAAKLMLVGEAPGEQETLAGRPFVGRAGKNLDEFLKISKLPREDLYITNAVKFRPTRISAAGNIVNRAPTKEEIKLFLPWLKREIALVNPRCVVTLGNIPLQALYGFNITVRDLHGQFTEMKDWLLYAMYHPASMIYNPGLKTVYKTDVLNLAQWVREYDRDCMR